MTHDSESLHLYDRWREGDESAATEIFHRYMEKLVALARQRISSRLQQRVGAEDVVQSVYRTFFRRAQEDQFRPNQSGDLWKLLVGITCNKVRQKWEHHGAQKRSYEREARMASGEEDHAGGVDFRVLASSEPTSDDAVALVEEIEVVMESLGPMERQVFELRLQDFDTEDIAKEIGRTRRTVNRVLEQIRKALTRRNLGGGEDDSPAE